MVLHRRIANALNAIRKDRKISQGAIAEKVGVSQHEISLLSSAFYKMKAYETIELYALAMGYKIDISLQPVDNCEVSAIVAETVARDTGTVLCQFGELYGRVHFISDGVYKFIQNRLDGPVVTVDSLDKLKGAKFYV